MIAETDKGAVHHAPTSTASIWLLVTAHLRRDFRDVWKSTDSPIAWVALDRVLYDIERRIAGTSVGQRLAIRQKESRPSTDAFRD